MSDYEEFEDEGPKVDPRFPDRPQHPDFWRLAAIVKQMDRVSLDEGWHMAIQKYAPVDVASLGYMAQQRAMRAGDLLEGADDREQNIIMWLDGFTAGMRLAHIEASGEAPFTEPDGNRRSRRRKK